MSNYPVWWNQTVTVYNKYTHPETHVITWHRTVLKNCFWKYSENKITLGETTLETNVTLCRVPKSDAFRERYEWEQITANVRCKCFTFGVGDIVVRGEVTEEISEYETGHRSTDFINKYKRLQGCMVVQQCSVNTGEGRGMEHYYVRGV